MQSVSGISYPLQVVEEGKDFSIRMDNKRKFIMLCMQ